jgi:hypothetical protein
MTDTIYQKRAKGAYFTTCYMKCPTGVYILCGTMPEYMQNMIFLDEEIAKTAVDEAVDYLNSDDDIDTFERSHRFARLWLAGQFTVGANTKA